MFPICFCFFLNTVDPTGDYSRRGTVQTFHGVRKSGYREEQLHSSGGGVLHYLQTKGSRLTETGSEGVLVQRFIMLESCRPTNIRAATTGRGGEQ